MSLHEDEWHKAQKLKISLDLITAAKSQLEFLAQVNAQPRLFDKPVLERAVERYEYCWLPLVANTSSTRTQLVPPLDCAWIWHCHRLNPVQYAEDCNRLFGRIVDAALLTKNDANEFTLEVWKAHYPEEPYSLDLSGNMTTKYSDRPRSITYDLVEAVSRQQTFYYQVSERHYLEESFLAAAGKRYKGFLHLISKHSANFFVPTYDIDLMWHTHQLSPICYEKDMLQLLGRILEHDDTDSNRNVGAKLDLGFTETCTLWEDTYGTPYQKAGCMFRGVPPIPQQQALEAMNSNKLVTLAKSSGEWLDSQKVHLRSRNMIKVHLAVRGAKGLSSADKSLLFVRLRALKKFEALKLDAPSSSDPQWNHVWTFESEISTQGIVLELRSQRHGISKVLLGSKYLGSLIITWKMVLDSETQTLGGWFPLATKKEASASLQVLVSVTPPVVGPYLLKSVRARPTGDDNVTLTNTSTRKGLWITRTTLDHTHNEVYVIRSRYKSGGFFGFKELLETEKVVHVHRGGWNYKGSSNSGSVPGMIAGSAHQIVDPRAPLSVFRTWSLLDGSVVLTIVKDTSDPNWNLRPQFAVRGSPHCAMTLLSGRKLEFAVADSTAKEEAGFVTVIRCTRDAPLGTATALFSWKTGAMQIHHEENVVLVLLLLTTIGMSMSDLLGKNIMYDTTRRARPDRTNIDDWGDFVSSSAGVLSLLDWWVQLGYIQSSTGRRKRRGDGGGGGDDGGGGGGGDDGGGGGDDGGGDDGGGGGGCGGGGCGGGGCGGGGCGGGGCGGGGGGGGGGCGGGGGGGGGGCGGGGASASAG